MLLLGHIGVSLVAAQMLDRAVLARHRGLDYRLLMVGSLLPDIVDKPIGVYLLPQVFHSGRIMGHTLLFSLILLGIGAWRYRRGRVGLFSLGLGSLFHLAEDEMWNQPGVLWWPLLGWGLAGTWSGESFLRQMLRALLVPQVFAAEAVGGLVLAYFLWRGARGRQRRVTAVREK